MGELTKQHALTKQDIVRTNVDTGEIGTERFLGYVEAVADFEGIEVGYNIKNEREIELGFHSREEFDSFIPKLEEQVTKVHHRLASAVNRFRDQHDDMSGPSSFGQARVEGQDRMYGWDFSEPGP